MEGKFLEDAAKRPKGLVEEAPCLRNRVVSYSTSGKAWAVMPEAESPCYRPCPVCGGVDAREWRRKATLTLVRCGGCGMVFESPLPGEFDSGAFYEGTGAAFYLSPDKLAGDHSPVRYERELKLFRRHVRTGRVLDVGCGTGGFTIGSTSVLRETTRSTERMWPGRLWTMRRVWAYGSTADHFSMDHSRPMPSMR